MVGNQTVLVATKDVSADRKPARTGEGWGGEMSLLTGPPDSTGGCKSALVDKLEVSPSRYHPPRSTSPSPGDSTTGRRQQCWDVSLTPSKQPISHVLYPVVHGYDALHSFIHLMLGMKGVNQQELRSTEVLVAEHLSPTPQGRLPSVSTDTYWTAVYRLGTSTRYKRAYDELNVQTASLYALPCQELHGAESFFGSATRSDTREIKRILRNLNVYCRVHKSPPQVHNPSHINSIHALQTYFHKVHFNSIIYVYMWL
jgi:hypothetical protein